MFAHLQPLRLLVALTLGAGACASDSTGVTGVTDVTGESDPADEARDGQDGAAGATPTPDDGARPRPAGSAASGAGDESMAAGAAQDAGVAGVAGDSGATPLPCDVAGVLEGHCIRCHAQSPKLGAPMPLLSWEDLDAPAATAPERKVRELILGRVLSNMDPMPPSPDPRLSAAQVDALSRWLEAGAEPGDEPRCLLPR